MASNRKQITFRIDPTGKLPWAPLGWRSAPERRVTLSRPPRGAEDLLKWIDFVLASPVYRIRSVTPNYTAEGFTHVVWNTWGLLDHVARRKKWVDRPRRPEPDRVITGLSGQELEFSATAVNRGLEDLRAYLLEKLPSCPVAAILLAPQAEQGLLAKSPTEVPQGLRPDELERCRTVLDAIVKLHSKPPTERITAKDVAQQLRPRASPLGGNLKSRIRLLINAKLVMRGDLGLQLTSEGLRLAQLPPN
jgi:hypothetical protein